MDDLDDPIPGAPRLTRVHWVLYDVPTNSTGLRALSPLPLAGSTDQEQGRTFPVDWPPCCDPDADDPPFLMGIFSSTGRALHYLAISGGWLAVLCAVILRKMPMGF